MCDFLKFYVSGAGAGFLVTCVIPVSQGSVGENAGPGLRRHGSSMDFTTELLCDVGHVTSLLWISVFSSKITGG